MPQHPFLHYMIRECVTSNAISVANYLPSVQPKFKQDNLRTPVRTRQKVLVSIQTEVISTDRQTRWIKLRFCTENNLNPCTVSGSRGGERWRQQKSFLVPIFEPRRLFVLLKTLSNRSRRKIDRSVKLSLTLRVLMSYIYIYIYIYIYMEHPFLMFLDHTQRRSTVGRTPLDE